MTRLVVLGVLALFVTASCGVPTQETADVAEPEDVPFGLLDENLRPAAEPNGTGRIVVEVFLYADDQGILLPVTRQVDRGSLPEVVAELERDPTEAETAVGLRNPLADVDAIEGAEVDGGVAIIDLSEAFSDLRGSDELIAIAQLVFTATARPGIGQVAFTLGGQRIEIPRGDGSLTREAVTREDYGSLAPP